MRIGTVIGNVTLSRRLESLAGGRFLLVAPQSGDAIRGGAPAPSEPIVACDEISPGLGAQVAISEGREAAMPFLPRRVPVDAYCAAILDRVEM